MKAALNTGLITAALVIIQVVLLSVPQQVLAIICPTGYRAVSGKCVKATTTVSGSQQSFVNDTHGSFFYTSDAADNALLAEKPGKLFDFGAQTSTLTVNYNPTTNFLQIFSNTNTATPDWLTGYLTEVVNSYTDSSGATGREFVYTDSLELFLRYRSMPFPQINPVRPDVSLIMNGDIAYGVSFYGFLEDYRFYVDTAGDPSIGFSSTPDYTSTQTNTVFSNGIALLGDVQNIGAPVPEPSTILLLGGGLAGLAGAGYRRRLKNRVK